MNQNEFIIAVPHQSRPFDVSKDWIKNNPPMDNDAYFQGDHDFYAILTIEEAEIYVKEQRHQWHEVAQALEYARKWYPA